MPAASSSRARSCLGLLLLLATIGPLLAQGPEVIGLDALEQDERRYAREARNLLKGVIPLVPENADHRAALDFEAKWDTYRYFYPEFHDPTNTASGRSIEKLFGEFESDLALITRFNNNPQNREATAQLFTELVIQRGREVLQTRRPIARINVARVLATLAELRQPALADALTAIIRDNSQIDGVRYYAFRGQHDLLDPRKGAVNLKADQLAAATAALMEHIERTTRFLPSVPQAEIEGFRTLRREAIRALGQVRRPTLTLGDKTVHPALLLLRVTSGKGFTPELRFDERIEAAIGLVRMQPDADKDYNPDYAAQHLALFLDDFTRFVQLENEEKQYPCRIYASKLYEGFEDLAGRTQDKYVASVVQAALSLLERIESDRRPLDAARLQELGRNPPAGVSTQLYKSVQGSSVGTTE